jgi:hypothetical protein
VPAGMRLGIARSCGRLSVRTLGMWQATPREWAWPLLPCEAKVLLVGLSNAVYGGTRKSLALVGPQDQTAEVSEGIGTAIWRARPAFGAPGFAPLR